MSDLKKRFGKEKTWKVVASNVINGITLNLLEKNLKGKNSPTREFTF